MTSTAKDNQLDFNVLFVIALPVLIGVWEWLAFAGLRWNSKRKDAPESVGGPSAAGKRSAEWSWIVITSVVVLFLAGFGTVELYAGTVLAVAKARTRSNSRRCRQGRNGRYPGHRFVVANSNEVLPVQVIAQQWKFTYRYPTFGGFESPFLILPNDTQIAFNVTSLDVIHSFWAYQLEVKPTRTP